MKLQEQRPGPDVEGSSVWSELISEVSLVGDAVLTWGLGGFC